MRPRRDLLRSLGAALTAGLAGCSGVFSGDDPETPLDDAPPTDGSTPTRRPTATLTPSPTPSPTPTPEPTPTFGETVRTPTFNPGGGDLTAFGTEVALADGLAVAGSPAQDAGSVYVFESGSDRWTQAATFVPDDATNFGRAVALAGETVVAGAPDTDTRGAAYVFERTDDGWTRQTRLRPPTEADDEDFRDFGRSVAYDGATAVVGEIDVHIGPEASFTGQVFAFEGSGADWTDGTRITTGDFDLFGTDVAVAGDRMLVGAPHAETAPDTNSGAVYEYERTDGGWQQAATIVPEDAAHHELFGGTVALDGTTAVVAAPGLDGPGAAYVFERTDGGWSQQARLTPGADDATNAEPDSFGVACRGDVAVVGVPQAPESGRAYTFERVDGEWRGVAALVPREADPAVNDFGWSVALDGDTAFVGAPLASGPRRGTGYLFDV